MDVKTQEKYLYWPHGVVGEHRSARTPQSVSGLQSRFSQCSTSKFPPSTPIPQNSYLASTQKYTVAHESPHPRHQHSTSWKPTTTTGEKRRRLRIEHFQDAFRRKNMELFVEKTLGHGKYSKVYKAHDMKVNRMIAIKAIDLDNLSEDVRKKFLPREIRCWKKLRHVNIVALHAQYEAQNMIFLAMEFGTHGDLLRYVQKSNGIDENRAGKYMCQLMNGLRYMHSKGIAHRDIKLENIILFDDVIKLSDFGFVRQMEENSLSETFCGSKSYSAPEILNATCYNPFLSDVWSAGVVGYIMVTNRMPFNENLPNETIVEHQRTRRYDIPKSFKLSLECINSFEYMMTFEVCRRPTSEQCLSLPWIAPYL